MNTETNSESVKISKIFEVNSCQTQKKVIRRKISPCINDNVYKCRLSKQPTGENFKRRRIIYARVDSYSQKEDLKKQIKFLQEMFKNHEIIKDIGSGLSYRRKGFNTIMELAHREEIEELVVIHREDLCRFGFELIEKIISQGNGKILTLSRLKTSSHNEVAKDLLRIINFFSEKYGLQNEKINETFQDWKEYYSKNENFSN
jgi:predicted site-specific integrase-resolvase